MIKFIENKLVENFKERSYFSKAELYTFLKSYEPDLKESTFAWRIFNLKKKNIIKSVKRGIYIITSKPKFSHQINQDIFKISKKILELFDDVKYCIWDTSILNEFMRHQSVKKKIIIEIENDFSEILYYELKDRLKYDIFLNPSKKTMDLYVSESQNTIIIKRLISRSPILAQTHKKHKIYSPSIEKILVDLFTDDEIFYIFQGSELLNIYENAIKKYPINYSKLFSYAKRRKKEKDIKNFIKDNMFHLVKEIIND